MLAGSCSGAGHVSSGRSHQPPANAAGAAARGSRGGTHAAAPTTVTVSEPPWALTNPLSRMVVLDAGNSQLVLAGGLTAADTSASGVFRLDLANGALTAIATLPDAVHDAAGAVIDGRDLIIGGGSTATIGAVQAVPVSGGPATVLSQLPQPRSDDTATTTGRTTVVVGGYDGSSADPGVLTTTNGTTFTTVADLPVPVRYSAIAAIGNEVYVFGGLAVAGPDAGQPVDSVQQVNLASGATSTLAPLPEPLEGASAFVLGGRIFVAGGDTATAGSSTLTSASSIWAFTPPTPGQTAGHGSGTATFAAAGSLAQAVSNAGVALSGGSAWMIGGEHDGVPVTTVQQIRPAG